jgi:hypothetical protein
VHKPLPDSDVIEPLTPDLLAYGFTRKLRNIPTLTNPNVEPDPNELPPPLTSTLKAIREYYLNHWWTKLKERTLTSIQQKCKTKTDGTPSDPNEADFVTGDPVLIYTGTARKLDFHYVLCQVLQRKGKNTYWVLHREGVVREENFYNMKKVVRCPIQDYDCEVQHGPSRFGQAIRVEFFCFRPDGTRLPDTKWYRGFLGQYNPDTDDYKIHWTSGEPSTAFDLRESRWFPLFGRKEGGHDTHDVGRSNHDNPDFESFTTPDQRTPARGSMDPLAIDFHADPISTPRNQEIHEYLGVKPQDIFGPRVKPNRRK